MKKVSAAVVIVALACVFCARIAPAQTTNVNTSVAGNAGPWSWTSGGLNSAYGFSTETPIFGAPTVLSAANGFRFAVGDTLSIHYVSGLIANNTDAAPSADAGGILLSPLNNQLAGSYGPAPSYYMNPATYPINLAELVGTFANNSGQIVGTPFAIGNLATVSIPAGATRLELGVNDNLYADNSGSWTIQVSGAAVPEPATAALIVMGLAICGLTIRRR